MNNMNINIPRIVIIILPKCEILKMFEWENYQWQLLLVFLCFFRHPAICGSLDNCGWWSGWGSQPEIVQVNPTWLTGKEVNDIWDSLEHLEMFFSNFCKNLKLFVFLGIVVRDLSSDVLITFTVMVKNTLTIYWLILQNSLGAIRSYTKLNFDCRRTIKRMFVVAATLLFGITSRNCVWSVGNRRHNLVGREKFEENCS